ncbi:MAG: family 16 glycoside hydrolase [Pirellulaceae bacterium]
MRTLRMAVSWCAIGAVVGTAQGEVLRYVRPQGDSGMSAAVVVGDVALAHTAQVLPLDTAGRVVGPEDATAQAEQVLEGIGRRLSVAQSGLGRTLKLNVYCAEASDVPVVRAVLARRFNGPEKPAVSYVVTPLPGDGVRVAMDAVAVASGEPARSVQVTDGAAVAVAPPGSRIYVAGQAEKGETLVEATRKTLESLHNTLRFLGRRDADIVQIKAFLSPMSDVKTVQSEVAAFFGAGHVPPAVYVEWTSPLIEIELIAWGGNHNAGPPVEYITPPGMTASPVFCRVTRMNSTRTIFVSGLYGPGKDDADLETKSIFEQLQQILTEAGSDLRHLVKATYYCSTDTASRKLNELRPNYYDPARPPSASKAMVRDVGRTGCGLTVDMIAVPAWSDAQSEYGPAERGHGLTEQAAREGWVSLFDGESSFGWTGGSVDAAGITGAATTTPWGKCRIVAEVTAGGELRHGDTVHALAPGTHELILDGAPASVELQSGLRVRQLQALPLELTPLLNGRDMTGWQRIDRQTLPDSARPKWTVADGKLVVAGGPGALEYTGQRYADFVLQVDVRTLVRHANGGLFVRSIPGDFMNGYEVQIYHRAMDGDAAHPARYSTGAIDDRQMARRLVSRDLLPCKITVVARGNHLATWVNGAQQTDWTDARMADDNPRLGLRTAPGTLQLQAHDPGTALEFSDVRIAVWPD